MYHPMRMEDRRRTNRHMGESPKYFFVFLLKNIWLNLVLFALGGSRISQRDSQPQWGELTYHLSQFLPWTARRARGSHLSCLLDPPLQYYFSHFTTKYFLLSWMGTSPICDYKIKIAIKLYAYCHFDSVKEIHLKLLSSSANGPLENHHDTPSLDPNCVYQSV